MKLNILSKIKYMFGINKIISQRKKCCEEITYLESNNQNLLNTKRQVEESNEFLSTKSNDKLITNSTNTHFQNYGYCHCCDSIVKFFATGVWWRDQYICTNCLSIPRERALMYIIEKYFTNWKELKIHESSPTERGASIRLKNECKEYSTSQFFPGIEMGSAHLGYQCQNLENLTFENESFDLFITQDVFEHIFHPDKAFKEIARVLKHGGAHIFTTPLVNKNHPSSVTAKLDRDGKVEHLIEKPEYHGNPISSEGSLVTMHYGFDIVETIYNYTKMISIIERIDSLDYGIRAEYIEVIISKKY